jgi:HD superfamily phosphohydrolase
MYNILNKNKEKIHDKDVIRASQLIPLSNKSCKLIVFLVMLISVFSYIYPEYSLNSLLKKTNNKLKNIDIDENKKNDQLIMTEFKLLDKDINNNNKYNDDNIYKIIKNTNSNINANELVDIDIVRDPKLEPIIIENNISETINFNDISSNLDIFNKIEPIKVEFIKSKPININKSDINLKKMIPNNDQVNINKLRESLRKFNDISL